MDKPVIVRDEPGDGYHYVAVIIPWTDGECGALGTVADGYLVVCGLNGRAHLIQREGFLSTGYVGEKFGLGPKQAAHFAKLVASAVGREHD